MKKIIFHAIDNFGSEYSFETVCEDDKVDDIVDHNLRLSTEITGHDVCDYTEHKHNDVTSFFYYMWNRWSEEECKKAFAGGDYNHFWNKWCEAYDTMKGPRGAAELFYMMLSKSNRDLLVKRALECYEEDREIVEH